MPQLMNQVKAFHKKPECQEAVFIKTTSDLVTLLNSLDIVYWLIYTLLE